LEIIILSLSIHNVNYNVSKEKLRVTSTAKNSLKYSSYLKYY
jgi:hypothetical protein